MRHVLQSMREWILLQPHACSNTCQISLSLGWYIMCAVCRVAGCTFCKPPVSKLSPEVIHACSTEFFKAFSYSKCTLDAS